MKKNKMIAMLALLGVLGITGTSYADDSTVNTVDSTESSQSDVNQLDSGELDAGNKKYYQEYNNDNSQTNATLSDEEQAKQDEEDEKQAERIAAKRAAEIEARKISPEEKAAQDTLEKAEAEKTEIEKNIEELDSNMENVNSDIENLTSDEAILETTVNSLDAKAVEANSCTEEEGSDAVSYFNSGYHSRIKTKTIDNVTTIDLKVKGNYRRKQVNWLYDNRGTWLGGVSYYKGRGRMYNNRRYVGRTAAMRNKYKEDVRTTFIIDKKNKEITIKGHDGSINTSKIHRRRDLSSVTIYSYRASISGDDRVIVKSQKTDNTCSDYYTTDERNSINTELTNKKAEIVSMKARLAELSNIYRTYYYSKIAELQKLEEVKKTISEAEAVLNG